MTRRARDFKGTNASQNETLQKANLDENSAVAYSGINGGKLIEAVPKFDSAPFEVVIKNENNSWIVLGRDRPDSISSGYGGRGNTQAASIDIVVGRMAGTKDGPETDLTVAPNFFTDAARIYVSQKTDVDRNFGLVGDTQIEERSAVAVKADAVRMIGREGIKLVTGKAKGISGAGAQGERNSQGGTVETVAGIELIAGNDVRADELEPLVKAYALADTLDVMVKRIQDLTDIVTEIAQTQTQINLALCRHTHTVPLGPAATQTTPPIDAAIDIAEKEAYRMSFVHNNLYKQKINLGVGFSENRLSPLGKKWFGSRWNKTN